MASTGVRGCNLLKCIQSQNFFFGRGGGNSLGYNWEWLEDLPPPSDAMTIVTFCIYHPLLFWRKWTLKQIGKVILPSGHADIKKDLAGGLTLSHRNIYILQWNMLLQGFYSCNKKVDDP